MGSKGGKWTPYLRFYIGGGDWKELQSHEEIIEYFQRELQAEKETIIFSEIRKYNLWRWIPGWVGNWHEYTLVQTTNSYWSFEKNMEGIFVQRSEKEDDVRCHFGGEKRNADRTEGRFSKVSFGENILHAVKWIINRDELSNTYHVFESNCHFFASLLYGAITRTSRGRRLSNTV